MKRMIYFAIFLGLAMAGEARALGGLADVAIVDRDSGAVLSPYFYRGEYWVAGRPGARYAIEIRNRLGERVLAVTAVDGVNVVSGATASWDQTGYVFRAEQRYQITGWRKSDAEVAAFTFTESPNSYAEKTGRPANVGVIGVAIFRERQVLDAAAVDKPMSRLFDATAANAAAGRMQMPPPKEAPLPAQTPLPMSAQRMTPAPSAGARASAAPMAAAPFAAAPIPASPKLGTGHGEREYSYVDQTEFTRMQPQPNEVIRIRYDSLDNLMAMGIVRRPGPPAAINPFPASPAQQYVPDPRG